MTRHLSAHFVMIGFLLQAIIPAGFMPAFANDGTTIVICSGVTGELLEIQFDGESSDHDGKTTSSKCSYSTVGAYNDVSIPNLVKLDALYIPTNAKIEDALVAQSIVSSNHTRGPPIISLI